MAHGALFCPGTQGLQKPDPGVPMSGAELKPQLGFSQSAHCHLKLVTWLGLISSPVGSPAPTSNQLIVGTCVLTSSSWKCHNSRLPLSFGISLPLLVGINSMHLHTCQQGLLWNPCGRSINSYCLFLKVKANLYQNTGIP